MSLLDYFDKEKRHQASIVRNTRRLKEVYAQAESRQKAIQVLREDGSEAAIEGLLHRFTVHTEPSITDQEEKEWVEEILVEFGERSLAPIKKFLRQREAVSWPLRAVQEISGKPAVVEMICDELQTIAGEYQRASSKKITLIKCLIPLGDCSEVVVDRLLAFVGDMDQDSQVAAIEALQQLDETGKSREAMLELFCEKADNVPRLKLLILEVFSARGWDVKGYRPSVEERIEAPFSISSSGVVKKQGTPAS